LSWLYEPLLLPEDPLREAERESYSPEPAEEVDDEDDSLEEYDRESLEAL
jgi:hypothetical protein